MTIKEIRNAAGMTQAALAEYIGVTKSAVEKWERGCPECPEAMRALIEYKFINEGIIKKEQL